jgi:hypothetical protein
VNLRHVPEKLRPPQETPDPDDDPTREWRNWRANHPEWKKEVEKGKGKREKGKKLMK